jgi:uncharacterized cupredoxin-like copper-binding protein
MLSQRKIGRALSFAAVVVAAGVALGCGSGDLEDPATGTTVIEVVAQELRFKPEVIDVPAGQTVTIRLKNLDDMEHDLEVRGLVPSSREGGGHGGHGGSESSEANISVHAAAGKTASVTFTTEQKGRYEVFCTQPGHEQLGMVATLVVS